MVTSARGICHLGRLDVFSSEEMSFISEGGNGDATGLFVCKKYPGAHLWRTPVVPAPLKAEARSLEPMSLRPARAIQQDCLYFIFSTYFYNLR